LLTVCVYAAGGTGRDEIGRNKVTYIRLELMPEVSAPLSSSAVEVGVKSRAVSPPQAASVMEEDHNPLPPMGSLSPECNELKKKYDDCFNSWFSRFLEGDQNLSVCDKYLTQYQACVQAAMQRMKIDVLEDKFSTKDNSS